MLFTSRGRYNHSATCSQYLAATANSAVIWGVAVNPPTTAGPNSSSTRSGPGSFHIYAFDNDNFGISSYNLTMGPAVTASNNRSPVTTIADGDGDTFPSGFSLLRSASNAPQMQGAQPLPGASPYLILGMGQTAGSFANIAATRGVQPGVVVGPTTQAAWGNYLTSGGDPGSGKKWLFLGEGTWHNVSPLPPTQSFVSAAVFTVYADSNFNSIASPNLPEPSTAFLAGLAMLFAASLSRRRSSVVPINAASPAATVTTAAFFGPSY